MKPVRIGMIGYGGIGRVHAMAYRSLPFHYGLPADSIQLVGVATTRPETAQAAAAEIGCEYWTDDYRQLLARPDIDVVDICVPNHMHAEIVQAAAAAGKHIYCEKPLAMNVAEAKAMVAAVQAAGVITQMTFNFRFFPAVLRAQQLVQEGFLGRIFSFRGRYYRSSYIDPQKPLTWRQRKAIAGGGALFDIGSHILDLLYCLLGPFAVGAGHAGHADPGAAGGGRRRPNWRRSTWTTLPCCTCARPTACWAWSRSRAWARG